MKKIYISSGYPPNQVSLWRKNPHIYAMCNSQRLKNSRLSFLCKLFLFLLLDKLYRLPWQFARPTLNSLGLSMSWALSILVCMHRRKRETQQRCFTASSQSFGRNLPKFPLCTSNIHSAYATDENYRRKSLREWLTEHLNQVHQSFL